MLHIHRAERADALAGALAVILGDPLEDPFAPEVVAVPTRGIERWLTQRLCTQLGTTADRADGVCANIDFPFPGRLMLGALATATGVDPAHDPWLAERSVWPLLELIDECLEEPWLATLKAHITGARAEPEDPARRFGVTRRIAERFDHYAVQRPEMLRSWATPGEAPGHADTDAVAWQAELWRRLRARIATPSPAERLIDACTRIRTEPDLVELPARISLFGLTRIPRSYLDVLAALAEHRDTHVFVLHPSPALWDRIGEVIRTVPHTITARNTDPTATAARNRLLASWGQDSRELQLVIDQHTTHEHHHYPSHERADTLLGRVQADIRKDETPPGPPLPGKPDARPMLKRDDRSLQIHACHGRARQVEVLRDAILHLLQEDPTLEPRDVIVMCPDIETIAPLIQATFGAGRIDAAEDDRGGDDSDDKRLPDLRVRLADRSLRQTNPVLSTVSLVLELADQRVTASQLLDLADREPVRRRFRFDDDDVTRMEEWVVASGIRWGLDDEHRKPFKLDVVRTNTWRAGLDRILLGVAMTEEDRRLVGGVLPLDDVESGAIDLAGRMAEFVDRTQHALDQLSERQTVGDWAARIATAADSLTATSERDSWQRAELQRLLDDVVEGTVGRHAGDGEAAGEHRPSAATLELADIRALLADRLRGRPTRANFRTGHLTICTLVPMRSVPHRVVCILGLDDGEFPRKAPRDGDDLLLDDPHVGDRDPRAEDRQMLLDALLAATERLIITYTGNDERTNLPRPPAVPVAELLDVVERTVRTEHGSARDHVLLRHPLQPFDPRNFTDGELAGYGPWSFDRVALAGARALSGPRPGRPPFIEHPLPRLMADLIELQQLVRFVEHPARAFLRGRLGISVRESLDEVDDALPIELGGLGEWGVGQRLLEGVLGGAELEDCVRAELARGLLPPAMLATPVLDRVRPIVEQIARAAQALGAGSPDSLDVNVLLPDGRTLAGTVAGVHRDTIRRVSYSRVRPRDRLAAWVRLLALTAARPERPFESIVIGRARSGVRDAQTTLARIPALAEEPSARARTALDHLAGLVDLYDRGMREPLPLATDASAAYAQAAKGGDDPDAAAQQKWETGFRYDKEDREPEHLLVYGGQIAFAELDARAPRSDEDLDPTQSRFAYYAGRLWDAVLDRELITDR